MYVTIIKKSEFESNRKHSIQKSYILFTYHLGQGPTMIISTKKKIYYFTVISAAILFSHKNIKLTYTYQFNLDLNFKKAKIQMFHLW